MKEFDEIVRSFLADITISVHWNGTFREGSIKVVVIMIIFLIMMTTTMRSKKKKKHCTCNVMVAAEMGNYSFVTRFL